MLVVAALPGASVASNPLPPYGYPLRQAPQCAQSSICPGDRGPSISPDGRQIAFMRWMPHANAFALMVMNADGTQIHALSAGWAHWSHPEWSPNERALLFECGYLICSVNIATTERTTISPPDHIPESSATWSPDGTRVVVVRGSYAYGGGWCCQIMVLDADGSHPVAIAGAPGTQNDNASPTWSPDGTQIAFVVADQQLWIANADGTNPHEIAGDLNGWPITDIAGWLSDGRIVVHTLGKALVSVNASGGDVQAIASASVGGPIPAMVGIIGPGAVSSDGWIGFDRIRPDGSWGIELVKDQRDFIAAEGVSVQARPQLTDFSFAPHDRLVFVSDGNCPAVPGIYVVDYDTGRPAQRLTQPCDHRTTAGPDFITGTSIAGGAGDDRLVADHAPSVISGGPGWDAIVSRNGHRDRISCGPGNDIVWADQLDVVARDCEVVLRKTVTLPPALPRTGTIALTCTECGLPPGMNGYLWLIRPSGRRIEIPFDAAGSARFSPDGKWIAYAEEGQIHVHSVYGLADHWLTTPTRAQDSDPAWLGTHTLVFTRATQVQPSGENITALETISTLRGNAKLLLATPPGQNPANVGFPDVSRTGTIAFSDNQGHLWTTTLRGGGRLDLAPGNPIGLYPRWSPDGTRVAALGQGQLPEIVDVTTGRIRTLSVSDDPSNARAFSWSPDGHWLAVAVDHEYGCNDPTGPCDVGQLWIADVKTGTARKVFTTPEGGSISSVDWTAR